MTDGGTHSRSRPWVLLVCLVLVVAVSHASMASNLQAPAGVAGLGAALPQATYAPDRVIVKLTPETAMGAMNRGGKTVPTRLIRTLSEVGVLQAKPLFADLWPAGDGAPIRTADKARAVRARFPQRAARALPGVAVPDLENIFILTLERGASVEAAVAKLSRDPEVVYAEPDYLMSVSVVPNDPFYSSMWNLPRIYAAQAWDITTGSDSVVMAVVDTGLDYNHPDIQGRVWENTAEVEGIPGIDDDDNGFVDDTMGWDFAYDDADPMDGHGHGTHVSGTIGAATNNSVGIPGICWQGKIMPVKGLSDGGSGTDSDLAAAMRYAAENGADVMNNSWGGYGVSNLVQGAVDYSNAVGCIVVAAAGNSNMEAGYFMPAGQRDVVCVGATDSTDHRAYFSNYGEALDVSAPGCCILSLDAGTDWYVEMSGTSMAAPHVTGALGLLVAAHPTWTISQLVGQLDGTADYIDFINDPQYAGLMGIGRINLYMALYSPSPTAGKRIILSSYVADDALGDDDGQVEPGERIRLKAVLKHFLGTSTNVAATLSSDDPYVTIVDGSTSFGTVSGWQTPDNAGDKFQFDVSSEWPAERQLVLTLTITADGYSPREYQILVPQWAGYCLGVAGPWWPWAEWDEEEEALGLYFNLDDFTWEPSAGYQLVAAGEMDRWGVSTVPLPASVASGELALFTFYVTGPPLTTLRYELPVTPTAPGTSDWLSCEWELCKGYFPLWGGYSSMDVMVSRFPDVQPYSLGAWARFWIEECAGRVPRIVGGYDTGDYRPTVPVDRASMAVYEARALKLPTAPYEARFPTDVPDTHWAWSWIEAMARAGLVGGYGGGMYKPALIVNRDAMAVYIARGMVGGVDVPTGPEDPTFWADVPTSYWAYDEVEYCAANGVVGGYGGGQYRPTLPVTRDQMAVFVYRGFIQPTGDVVVLGGPAITAVNPATAGYWGWSSLNSAPASDPGYAYVVLDAVRLGDNLADVDSFFDVYFEVQGPETRSDTVSLSADDLQTIHDAACASGVPYYAVSWTLPTDLTPGDYTLVVSAEDEPGVMHEIVRQPQITITP